MAALATLARCLIGSTDVWPSCMMGTAPLLLAPTPPSGGQRQLKCHLRANNAKRDLCNVDNFFSLHNCDILRRLDMLYINKSYAPLSTGTAQAAAAAATVAVVACVGQAGSDHSCKMPKLSHTLPNCQHSCGRLLVYFLCPRVA